MRRTGYISPRSIFIPLLFALAAIVVIVNVYERLPVNPTTVALPFLLLVLVVAHVARPSGSAGRPREGMSKACTD